jgi:GTP-binding protein
VHQKLEKFSIIKALKSLERCDVALIVLDAAQDITEQDIKVAGYAYERGCGSIWVVNKWDLKEKVVDTPGKFAKQLQEKAKYLNYAPTLTVSALTGQRISKIIPLINKVYKQYSSKVTTGLINRIMNDAMLKTQPSLYKGRRLKFYYTTQISSKPPTFMAFVNYPEAVHFSYQRYLINQIRQQTGLGQTPLRLVFRQRTGKLSFKTKTKKRHR